jgi:hypothetical protein
MRNFGGIRFEDLYFVYIFTLSDKRPPPARSALAARRGVSHRKPAPDIHFRWQAMQTTSSSAPGIGRQRGCRPSSGHGCSRCGRNATGKPRLGGAAPQRAVSGQNSALGLAATHRVAPTKGEKLTATTGLPGSSLNASLPRPDRPRLSIPRPNRHRDECGRVCFNRQKIKLSVVLAGAITTELNARSIAASSRALGFPMQDLSRPQSSRPMMTGGCFSGAKVSPIVRGPLL